MKDFVERVVRIQKEAEEIMRHAAGVLSEEIGTEVISVRAWGVLVSDADWVLNQPGAVVTRRIGDSNFPYTVIAEIDGVTFYGITSDPAYKDLVLAEEETA